MREGKTQWALNKVMTICSKSEKCISDIEKKLKQWEIPLDEAQGIIETLVQQKFIDEDRFAHFYVRDKFRFNRWGKKKITFMLKGKGLTTRVITEALNEISMDDYMEVLKELISSKKQKINYKDDYEKRTKLIRFAQGRGFEYDVICKVIDGIPGDES